MAGPNCVKFISYNSTGLNGVKTQWIRDLVETCGATFLSIQEHFKKTKSLQRFFQNEFSDFNSYVLPAHREEGRDTGRAQGGLAQLSLKTAGGVRSEKVNSPGWRLQAQILHFGGWRLLWVNLYFPNDPKVINFDAAELLVVQAQLQSLLENGGYDHCLCGGDWNYDARRNSGFARSMAEFLSRMGLKSVWESYPIDFTYMHTDHRSNSILDNFYVDEALLPLLLDAGPLHLGDNPSGHSPIMISLRVPSIPSRSKVVEEVAVPRRLAWEKAETEDIVRFKAALQDQLDRLEEPACLMCTNVKCEDQQHSDDRDLYVTKVVQAWVEASYTAIPKAPPPPMSSKKGKPQKVKLPGWETNCKPLSRDAKFWYSIWLSAGRPSSGQLHQLMVSTRVKFRAAVRRAKTEADTARAQSLLVAAQSGDKALLREMRAVLGSKHQKQEVPDQLEGEQGHAAVLEKFRSLYSALYNSAGSEGRMLELQQLMSDQIDCRSEAEVRKITPEVVSNACTRMKGGKSDVTQGYTSDIFRHATPVLCKRLATIFRSFLCHGTIPISILSCSLMPLLKSSRKDASKFDSWRAVAGASQLLKLFEYVVLNIWGDLLSSDSLQFGFKQGTGTDQCTWLLHAVAEHYVLRGSPVLCCLLDVRKGFPSVRFGDLFEILLLKKQVPAVVCRVLAFMYQEQTGFIKLQGRRSACFRITNGMREGAACSPFLWAVYADGLLTELRNSGLGCSVAGLWMGAMLYADDLSLLAPTRAILASMLALVEAYGAKLNLTFSSDQDPGKCKSFCLYFSTQTSNKVKNPSPLVLNGVTLPWKEKAVHLGHTLHHNLSFDTDASVRRAAFISSSVEVRNLFSFAEPAQIITAVRILCCSAYGSVLWRLDSSSASSFFKAYSSCIRRVYGLPLNTFTRIVEGHLTLGLPPLRNMVLARYPGFYHRLLSSPSREVEVMAEMAAKDARTITAANLALLARLTGLDVLQADQNSTRTALPVETVPESENWRVGLLDKLLCERTMLSKAGSDTKRIVALISSLCST